jgi:TetR/AcrR family transcriptional regulator of autoinduction and epiphytic fitness
MNTATGRPAGWAAAVEPSAVIDAPGADLLQVGRRAGRPPVLRSTDRRAYLLEAAAAVFAEKGYAAATVDAIAAKAGMSKKTVYRVFDSKLALFDALIDDRFFNIPEPPEEGGGTLEESLTRTLLAIAQILLRPDRTCLMRMIIAEGPNAPELMTAFERLKLGQELNTLERWFERQERCGALNVGNVREAARLVFGMTVAEPMIQLLAAAPRPLEEIPLGLRIAHGVRVFLYGLKAAPLPAPCQSYLSAR